MVGASVFMYVSDGRHVDVRASASISVPQLARLVDRAVVCVCGPDAWWGKRSGQCVQRYSLG
ncbi:MAG: hypothetical protein M3Y39_17655 [Chloroflexota bacterium]|nr:hypothetical protein [Chloroflexota bacterium]